VGLAHKQIPVAREEIVIVQVQGDRQMHAPIHERDQLTLEICQECLRFPSVGVEREFFRRARGQFLHARQ
jgi:hypothetical protein